jgi:hypothetical protein
MVSSGGGTLSNFEFGGFGFGFGGGLTVADHGGGFGFAGSHATPAGGGFGGGAPAGGSFTFGGAADVHGGAPRVFGGGGGGGSSGGGLAAVVAQQWSGTDTKQRVLVKLAAIGVTTADQLRAERIDSKPD